MTSLYDREAANIIGNLADSTKEIFAGFASGLSKRPGIDAEGAARKYKGKPSADGDGIK